MFETLAVPPLHPHTPSTPTPPPNPAVSQCQPRDVIMAGISRVEHVQRGVINSSLNALCAAG